MGGKVLHWVPGTGRGILGLSVEVWKDGQKFYLLVHGVGPSLCCVIPTWFWACNLSSVLLWKIRKTVHLVGKGCLNYFCPIKHLLVRVFLFFLVGLGFFFPAISVSLHWNPVPRFASPVWQCHWIPRYLTQATQEYPRQTQLSGWSPILKKTQALLPGVLFLSSKIIVPFASDAAALPLEVFLGQPKLPQGWLNWEQLQSFPAQLDQPPRSSVWPSLQPCDHSVLWLHPSPPPGKTTEVSQTIKSRSSIWTVKALPLKKTLKNQGK